MFDGLDKGVQVIRVGSHDLLRWADHVRPHLAKMADGSGGRYQTADIFAAMASGTMIPWVVVDGPELMAVLVTQLIQYPRSRAMRCIGISGYRARRWMHLLADVEAASRDLFGCDRMEALHQPRHGMMLCTSGWEPFHVLSEKLL